MGDSEKLIALAKWFDLQDDDKKAIGFETNDEVQKDLRRIADTIKEKDEEISRWKIRQENLEDKIYELRDLIDDMWAVFEIVTVMYPTEKMKDIAARYNKINQE